MKSGPSFFIAKQLLAGKSARSSRGKQTQSSGMRGAILGIGISLIPLVLVLVVSNGMIQGITNRYMETKTYHLQIALPAVLDELSVEKGRAALLSVAGVRGAFHETDGMGIAASAAKTKAVLLRSIDPGYFRDRGTMAYLKVLAGEATPDGAKSIVLGGSLASELHVSIGDSITMITPSGSSGALWNASGGADQSSMADYNPKLSIFKVTGIVSAGYRDMDALWAFISPDAGARILSPDFATNFFGIKAEDPFSNSLGTIRKASGDAFEPLYPEWFERRLIRTWPEIENNLYRSFGTTQSLLMLIMGIALLIAAVNLGSALSTFVAEHRKDIAVMRSTGASDSLIRRVFLQSGLITGVTGTVLGLLAGLFISVNINAIISGIEWILNFFNQVFAFAAGRPFVSLKLLDPSYYLEQIPIVINFGEILSIAALSILLCIISSLVPARKATRISVQELIRKS
ncbi:MAG: ABC transporter permease [Spirochaetaceae bacterium]|nr:ABC transporter permease [Spirochaetaceae bacterium]